MLGKIILFIFTWSGAVNRWQFLFLDQIPKQGDVVMIPTRTDIPLDG